MDEIPDILCVGGFKTPTRNERQSGGFTFNKFKRVFPQGLVIITPEGNELYIPPRTLMKIRRRIKDLENKVRYINHNSSNIDEIEVQNVYDSIEIAELDNHLQTYSKKKSKTKEILSYGLSPTLFILDVAAQVDYLLPIIDSHLTTNEKYLKKYRALKRKRGGHELTNPSYVFRLGKYPVIVSLAVENPHRLILKSIYEKDAIWPNNTCHIDYEVL